MIAAPPTRDPKPPLDPRNFKCFNHFINGPFIQGFCLRSRRNEVSAEEHRSQTKSDYIPWKGTFSSLYPDVPGAKQKAAAPKGKEE
jgi:hypothetical protein